MFLNIIIGLLGISFIVFIHELGHFLAAKAFKVEVEAFSIGMGKRIAGFKHKGTDYRISMLPFGGYCKMKGEKAVVTALENQEKEIKAEPGSFYYISAWKRAIIAFAGPLFNIIFTIIVFLFLNISGVYTIRTFINPSELNDSGTSPALKAGLEPLDEIISIDGKYLDYMIYSPTSLIKDKEQVNLLVKRNNEYLEITVPTAEVPIEENSEETTRKIGIGMLYSIGKLDPESSAAKSGIIEGDILLAVNNISRFNEDFNNAFSAYYSKDQDIPKISIKRDDQIIKLTPERQLDKDGNIDYFYGEQNAQPQIKLRKLNTAQIFSNAFTDPFLLIYMNFKGLIGSLDRDKDSDSETELHGPLQIIPDIGRTITSGISSGYGAGFAAYSFFQFLAILSVILGVMNLLPIPALDGGTIVVSIFETIRGKSLSVKALMRYQFVGMFVILLLTFLILKNDITQLFFK